METWAATLLAFACCLSFLFIRSTLHLWVPVLLRYLARLPSPFTPIQQWKHRRREKRQSMWDRILVRDRHNAERLRWAAEDLAEKREVRARHDGWRGQDEEEAAIDSLTHREVDDGRRRSAERRVSGFTKLPLELRLQIYSQLDYATILSLERTCRYFYLDSPSLTIPLSQRAAYAYHAETFCQNRDRLACFTCLRLYPYAAFRKHQRTGMCGKFDEVEFDSFDRVCFECEVEKGVISWPKTRRLVRRTEAWMRLR